MNQATNTNGGAAQHMAGSSALLHEIADETAKQRAAHDLLAEQSRVAFASGFVSEEISDEFKALTIAMIGRELGLGVMTALQNIHIIPGKWNPEKKQRRPPKPAISSQLKHALAIRKVPGFQLIFVQADEKACIVEAWRPSMKDKPAARFMWTREHSRVAGLLGTADAPSNHDKHGTQMFIARAVSIAVDAVCPEATMGFVSLEEARDEAYLDQIATMGTLPRAGDSSGRDSAPSAPASTLKSFAQLEALLDDCADVGELEAFRDGYKPDRLALPKEEREKLAKVLEEKRAKLGIAARANATKEAAKGAAAPAPVLANDAPPAEPAKSPRAPKRDPKEIAAESSRLEAQLLAEIDAATTGPQVVDVMYAAEHGGPWARVAPAAQQRVRQHAKERITALEGPVREEPATQDAEPTDEGGEEGGA